MSPATVRLLAILTLLGLPLASGWLAGFPAGFADLPPRSVYIDPPGFSTALYAGLTLVLVLTAALLLFPERFGFRSERPSDFTAFDWALAPGAGGRFPFWGWVGTTLIAAGWLTAWTRPGWLGPAADHTFFPLWLGYILVVDALAYYRVGSSPATSRIRTWLAWFPASAAAWWYFELLNRFIQNWLYLGVDQFSTLRYVLGSTLAFSTVIPAVLTTAALLSTFKRFRAGFVRTDTPNSAAPSTGIWWWAVAAGAAGLVATPWYPVALFALIWIAPLGITAGLLERAGCATGLGHLARGDWGPAVTLATAAVACGFFWELWNLHAMPKWIYQVPWLDRFKLFEMPIVGYLGYIPFGPACWAFWLLLSGRSNRLHSGQ